MNAVLSYLQQPWPWYIAGPLIGLTVPLLLLAGNKTLGISSSLRQICAMSVPGNIDFLKYDWKKEQWNLVFSMGLIAGGFIGGTFLSDHETEKISEATVNSLSALNIQHQTAMLPTEIFSWENLLTTRGIIIIVIGGFMVGFGTRYAGGCTSGHGIFGLSTLQWESLVAVVTFFAFGILTANFILPQIMKF
jgi:uncharacterized membrane protein YedE/YeeE